jgi:hypothetical protein
MKNNSYLNNVALEIFSSLNIFTYRANFLKIGYLAAVATFLLMTTSGSMAAETASILKPDARLWIAGDQTAGYSRFIETYLTACMPELKIRVFTSVLGGDSAGGFLQRIDNDLRDFKPNIVTLGYGINDGQYRAFDAATGKTYTERLGSSVKRLTANGVTVIVGGPPALDTQLYNQGNATTYNDTMGQLDAIADGIATENKMPHAEVYGTMKTTMEKAKATLGADYAVGGQNGGPCRPNGQLVMAYAYLKAMGMNGDLGTITIDIKGTSAATGGHKMLSDNGGKVEVESTRYPFCFTGNEKTAEGTRSILPFFPFNQELNRLTLVVRNLGAERGKVTWGSANRTFSRQELEQGINLAAAFPENPFSAPFARVFEAVVKKQEFDSKVIRAIAEMPALVAPTRGNAKGMEAIEVARKRLWHNELVKAEIVSSTVVSVKHMIEVQPVP